MPRRCRIVSLGLVGALALTRCASSPFAADREPGKTPDGVAARTSAGDAALERQVYELVNRHRRDQSLAPLALEARISEQARRHSIAMAAGRMPLGHQGFEERVSTLRRAMTVWRSAENVAVNQGYGAPARQAFEGWLASAPHRENIEGPYESTGIGVARNAAGEIYFTQIFIGR